MTYYQVEQNIIKHVEKELPVPGQDAAKFQIRSTS